MSYTDGDYNTANPPASTGERYVYAYGASSTTKADSIGSLTHSYTTNGLITDHAQYDVTSGNPASSTDGAGVQTSYQYDSSGNISVITQGGVYRWATYDANYSDQRAPGTS